MEGSPISFGVSHAGMLNAHRERREEICVCDVLTGKPGVKLSCYKIRLGEKETTDRQERNGEKSVCSNIPSPERKKKEGGGRETSRIPPPALRPFLVNPLPVLYVKTLYTLMNQLPGGGEEGGFVSQVASSWNSAQPGSLRQDGVRQYWIVAVTA